MVFEARTTSKRAVGWNAQEHSLEWLCNKRGHGKPCPYTGEKKGRGIPAAARNLRCRAPTPESSVEPPHSRKESRLEAGATPEGRKGCITCAKRICHLLVVRMSLLERSGATP